MESFLKEHCDVSMVLKWQNTSHFLTKFQYKLLTCIYWQNPTSVEEHPLDLGTQLPLVLVGRHTYNMQIISVFRICISAAWALTLLHSNYY